MLILVLECLFWLNFSEGIFAKLKESKQSVTGTLGCKRSGREVGCNMVKPHLHSYTLVSGKTTAYRQGFCFSTGLSSPMPYLTSSLTFIEVSPDFPLLTHLPLSVPLCLVHR